MASNPTPIADGVVMPFYARQAFLRLDPAGQYWPVMVSPKDTLDADGKVKGMTMGGPVAYCDSEHNAKELATILNRHDAAEWARVQIVISRNDSFEIKPYITMPLGLAAWKGITRDPATVLALRYERSVAPNGHSRWTMAEAYNRVA